MAFKKNIEFGTKLALKKGCLVFQRKSAGNTTYTVYQKESSDFRVF